MARERVAELSAEFASRGDATGWFEQLYSEAEGEASQIPWADLEPNRFFKAWAEKKGLKGNGRTALVVGCGLGDDARFLYDLGFKVTAFDISPTAIEWAKKLHAGKAIEFIVADLFDPPKKWVLNKASSATVGGSGRSGFDLVLEIHTIQPLPLSLRQKAIDAVASFVGEKGKLVVVARGREDDEPVGETPPWPVSLNELKRFEENGLLQTDFEKIWDEEDEQMRFIAEYDR